MATREFTEEQLVEAAEGALPNTALGRVARRRTIAEIQQVVATFHSLTVEDLKGKDRHQSISRARRRAMALCREVTGASYPELGREFGGRDHTTAITACRAVVREEEESAQARAEMAKLRELVEG